MSHGYISPEWVSPPDRIVSWMCVDDNTNGELSVNHPASASASVGTPSFDMESDNLTHNINLSITTKRGNSVKKSVPDGSKLVRYREPDRESFIFDPKKGHFFDPTTGLHYNANSGLFLNYKHGVMLRWDSMLQSYIKAGIMTRPRPDTNSQPQQKRPHDDGMEMSKCGGTKRKREVWNRLGPSSKRQHSGTTNHSDSEAEIEERMVRLVRWGGGGSNQDFVDDPVSIKDEYAVDVSVASDETEAYDLENDDSDIGFMYSSTTYPPEAGSGTSVGGKHEKIPRNGCGESSKNTYVHEYTNLVHKSMPKTNITDHRGKYVNESDIPFSSEHTIRKSVTGRSAHHEKNQSTTTKARLSSSMEHPRGARQTNLKQSKRKIELDGYSTREPERSERIPSKETNIYCMKAVRPSTKESEGRCRKDEDAHIERSPVHFSRAYRRSKSKDTTGRSRHTARPRSREFRRSYHKEAEVDCRKGPICYNKEPRRSRSREVTIRGTVRSRESLRSHSRDRSRASVGRDNWKSRRSCSRGSRSSSRGIVRRNRESRRSWSREDVVCSREMGRSRCRESDRSLSRERRGRRGRSPRRGILLHRQSSRSWSREAADFCRKIARSSSRELRRSVSRGIRRRRGWSPGRDTARCSNQEFRRSWSREANLQTSRNRYFKSRDLSMEPRRSHSIETVTSCNSVARREKRRMTRRSSTRSSSREYRRSLSLSPFPLAKQQQSRSIESRRSNRLASTKRCTRKPKGRVSRSPSCTEISAESETDGLNIDSRTNIVDSGTIENRKSSPTPLDSSPKILKVDLGCCESLPVDSLTDDGHSKKCDQNRQSTKPGKNQNSLAKSHESILIIENKLIPKIEASDPTEISPPGNSKVIDSDEGDVLAHLFNMDNQACTNIVLVAPVPLQNHSKHASDALKNQIGNPPGLRNVYINHERLSGSPCSYIMISFMTTSAARNWYDSHKGFLILSGSDGSKLKGYLHFMKKGNWNCKYCKCFNFFMQTLCSKCYRAKDDTFSPITVSTHPSKWVGIAKLDSRFMTVEDVIKSLPPLSSFKISSTNLIRDPKGLPLGLCVFEVANANAGSELCEFFLSLKRNAVYVTVNDKPKTPEEEYLSCIFDKMTPFNNLLVALIFDKVERIVPLHVMELNLELVEMNLRKQLEEDDVKYEKITSHINTDVGAPYCYVLITFADIKTAVNWLELRRNTFINFSEEHRAQLLKLTFKISPHFAENNWECRGCLSINFSLRSLCHRCFKLKGQNELGLISQSMAATKWLAVSEFSNWADGNEHIVASFREHLKQFIFKQIEVLRDGNCQHLPLACVFEMPDKAGSIQLREFLHAEGMCCVFVVPHKELGRCCDTDPSGKSDLLIVEAPPPACIDLTSKDESQLNEKRLSPAPEVVIVEQPPSVSVTCPTCDPALPSTADVNGSFTVAPFCEEPLSECIDLTNDADSQPSQLAEKSSSTCLPEIASPVDQMPAETPVIPMSQNIEFANVLGVVKQVSAISTPKIVNFLTKNVIDSVVTTESEVISVCPVPRLQGNTQWLYAIAFLKYGAEFTSVEFCEGDSFGVPYNYCLVHFTSSETAKLWCTKHRGSIRIEKKYFPKFKKLRNLKACKAFLNFSEKNWHCNCGKRNCWTRSICYNCLKYKGADVGPFTHSPTPTKYLAVKLFKWHPIRELTSFFPGYIQEVLNACSARVMRGSACELVKVKLISDPRIRKDKFGIYIFEISSSVGAVTLLDYFKQSLLVESASFVEMTILTAGKIVYQRLPHIPFTLSTAGVSGFNATMNVMDGTPAILASRNPVVVSQQQRVEPSTSLCVLNDQAADGVHLELPSPVSPNSSLANAIDSTPAILGLPKPDYEAIIWTSFFGFHLNQPPTNVVMIPLCLDYRELPDGTRAKIQDSLQKVGVSPVSIIFSPKRDVGSPFSYCMILFNTLCSAKRWSDECNDESFRFEVSRPDDKKIPLTIQDCYSHVDSPNGDVSYFIKSKLYYSLPNWSCSCGHWNFPLRSVCHSCLKNKDKTGQSSVSRPTKLLGIKLTKHLEAMDTGSFYLVRKLGFPVYKIHVGLDAAVPRDPYGIVIFEMLTVKDSVKFLKFLTDLIRGKEIDKDQHHLIKNMLQILDHSSGIIFLK